MPTTPLIHWRIYAIEAAGLGGFVLIAALVTILLEHPDGPVMQTKLTNHPMLRRVPLGLVMGAYMVLVIKWAGKSSGAHINPAVTWAFYRLGKISLANAFAYMVAQYAGASAVALLLKAWLGQWFSRSPIHYGVTAPIPPYTSTHAFWAEALITFLIVSITLFAISSKRWEKRNALISGLLIMLYLIFETPYSGMSMNPARSFAGSLAANEWAHLWIYVVAPVGASLLAAELFMLWDKQRRQPDSLSSDYQPISHYPVVKQA